MILLVLIFYFLAKLKAGFAWLILPVSLFCDLWQLKPLGLTGLQTTVGLFLIYLLFSVRDSSRGKYWV